MERLAKIKGPRGEVRVNSEKRWLKGTPKKSLRMWQACIVNSKGSKAWHLGDNALVEVDFEIFGVAFFKLTVFFMNFLFKVS